MINCHFFWTGSDIRQQARGLDDLPEELLDMIVSYLAPSESNDISFLQGLLSVSFTSRKLDRIALPHLYATPLITFNERLAKVQGLIAHSIAAVSFGHGKPATVRGNAAAFLRTISHRRELALCIKTLYLKRNKSDVPLDQLRRMRSVGQEPRVLVPILQHISAIVRLEYCTDWPYETLPSFVPMISRNAKQNFNNLKTVRFDCRDKNMNEMWMWFSLPNLEHLCLLNVLLVVGSPRNEHLYHWESARADKLKHIELLDSNFLSSNRGIHCTEEVILVVIQAAPALETLKIGYSPEPWQIVNPRGFALLVVQYSHRIKELTIEPAKENPAVISWETHFWSMLATRVFLWILLFETLFVLILWFLEILYLLILLLGVSPLIAYSEFMESWYSF